MSEPVYEAVDILACDFSFRRPGFAYMRYYPRGKKISL